MCLLNRLLYTEYWGQPNHDYTFTISTTCSSDNMFAHIMTSVVGSKLEYKCSDGSVLRFSSSAQLIYVSNLNMCVISVMCNRMHNAETG